MPFPSVPELHGALTHFPVALLMTACIFEIAAWVLKKSEWRTVSFWTLALAVVTAVPALVTGWLAGNTMFAHAPTLPTIFVLHRALAFGTSGLALALLIWRAVSRDVLKGSALAGAVALVVVVSAAVGLTGYFGGQMVFGGKAEAGGDEASAHGASGQNADDGLPPLAMVAAGKKSFQAQGCQGCHLLQGKGTAVGPDLTHEGRRHATMSWQVAHLQNPSGFHPGSTMPSYAKLKPEELKSLAAFLVTRN